MSIYQQLIDRRIARSRAPGRNARHLMSKKTAPLKVAPWIYHNGERAVAFRNDIDLYEFSGSSFNRQLDAKRKKKIQDTEETEAAAHAVDDGSLPISPDDILCDDDSGGSGDAKKMAESNDRSKHRVRMLSARSRQKIRDKMRAFWDATEDQYTFVTLSFIEFCEDQTAVQALNKFLTACRKYFGVGFNYIWVIERQENGNPHFHIMVNRRFDIVRFNSLWVLQQYRSGLRGYSRRLGRVIYPDEIEERHCETVRLLNLLKGTEDKEQRAELISQLNSVKIGRWLNPFDVKKISGETGLSFYMTKYVTKNTYTYSCLTWHCSRGVSKLFTRQLIPFETWEAMTDPAQNYYVNKEGEIIEARPVQPVVFCVLVYARNRERFGMAAIGRLRQVNRWILNDGFEPDITRLSHDEYMRNVFTLSSN